MLSLPAPASLPAQKHECRDLLDAFLEGRKATTVKAYAGDLLAFARFCEPGAVRAGGAIDAFLRLDAGNAHGIVLRYRNALVAGGLASATIARRLAALRSITKLARQLGRIAWTVEVEAPRPEARRDVAGPDPADRKKLWKAMRAGDSPRDRRDRAMVALLFGLGLRRAEVVALDLADLDFRGKTVAVLGKGKRERSRIVMPPEVAGALEAWVVVREPGPGPLFHRTDRAGGGRLTGEALALAVARAGEAAGLAKKLRPHGLRHSCITAALELGITPRDVRDFSRHANIETVMRYDDERDKAAPRVAARVARELKG